MVKLGKGTRGAHTKNGNSTYHLAVFFCFVFFFCDQQKILCFKSQAHFKRYFGFIN